MNVIDRRFAAEADRHAKAPRARKKLQRRIAILAALAVALAAIVYYVWATTLCGDCGAPMPAPPPPA
jgi:hypothetical protein